MKRNKRLLFLFILLFLTLTGAKVVIASTLQVPLPGLCPDPNNCTAGLPEYVNYIFTIGIGLAGGISLISFTIGAIGLISPNPESHKDSRDRMKGASLGLVLTIASFLILKTINPALTTLIPSTPLPRSGGVYVIKNGNQYMAMGKEGTPDVAQLLGYNTIKYLCAPADTQVVLVWFYDAKDYKVTSNSGYYSKTHVGRLKCGDELSVGSGSFKWDFEKPGVYLCMNTCETCADACNGSSGMCSGYMSDFPYTDSLPDTGPGLAGKIGGVRIVSDTENNTKYSVILHKSPDYTSGGECNQPITNQLNDPACMSVPKPENTVSADILPLDSDVGAAGNGVNFYSEPYGLASKSRAFYFNVPGNQITIPNPAPFGFLAKDMIYQTAGVNATPEYTAYCKTFQDCPGSISMKGSYTVALYENVPGTPGGAGAITYCQTFQSRWQDSGTVKFAYDGIVADLSAQPILASGPGVIGHVYIFPTK